MQSSTNRKTWLVLAVLLGLFIVVSYVINARQPEPYPPYVSDSPSPTGTKAFYTYLENERTTVGRWTSSPELLPETGQNQLLVMVEPSFVSGEEEMNAYEEFIEAGNTILLFKQNPDGMFDLRTVQAGIKPEEPVAVTGMEDGPYEAEIASPVRLEVGEADELLFEDEAGAIAINRPVGDGNLIVATEPEWLTNDKLLDANHTELVFSLLEKETDNGTSILFDEYTHTGQGAGSFAALFPKWLVVFAVQAVLLSVIWLWYRGKRFGPVVVPREESVRFSDERLTAVAAWYQRGHQYGDALAIQADYLKLLLQERWGIPYSKGWPDIVSQLEKRIHTIPGSELAAFTNELTDVLRKPELSKQEFLLWSRKIDEVREEVEQG